MMSLFIKLFIQNKEDVSNPSVKKTYATLSSIVGILLNLFLCTAKIAIGVLSHSVAISADGFNNLSDAGTNLVSLLGFKIAGYGGGSAHPFSHGRIEWIMGIFASITVLLMGIKLAGTSAEAITDPHEPTISAAADCISDAIATAAVLVSTAITYATHFEIDGYCGVLVSLFIIFAGIKSLWEVLGRIMGKSADADTRDSILQTARSYPEIISVHDLMLHDYGFGYFVVSMRVEGYRKDSRKLYIATRQIAYELRQKFHCDCFIQIDYLLHDEMLTHAITEQIYSVSQKYSNEIQVDNFRLIENSPCFDAAFDMVYPAELQNREEEIRNGIMEKVRSENPECHLAIKGIIRRERLSLHR